LTAGLPAALANALKNSGVFEMKKIMLAAAIVAISGSAFAASDNYGSNGPNQPAVTSLDNTHTASVRKSATAEEQPVAPGSDRNLFGNN
jgi:hypothetical protein